MNLLLVEGHDFIGERRVAISDDRYRHVRKVLGSSLGDTVRVGEVNGLTGVGEIVTMTDRHLELELTLDQPPTPKLPLTIVLALPRPKMVRRIFRTAAELGVERLAIINSYKVEKSFWKSPALEPDKVRGYLLEGLQQSRDTVIPDVTFHRLFKPFVEDELATLAEGSQGLIAHPGIGERCPHALQHRTTLAIGPEGGFTDYEVRKFQERGFDGVHLGARILRVETALTAIVSKLYD